MVSIIKYSMRIDRYHHYHYHNQNISHALLQSARCKASQSHFTVKNRSYQDVHRAVLRILSLAREIDLSTWSGGRTSRRTTYQLPGSGSRLIRTAPYFLHSFFTDLSHELPTVFPFPCSRIHHHHHTIHQIRSTHSGPTFRKHPFPRKIPSAFPVIQS